MPRRKPTIEGSEEQKNTGGAFAVLIVIVLIAGVIWAMSTGGGPPTSRVENLLAQAEVATSGITKESFTFEGSLEASSDAGYFGIPVSGEGRIDIENKRMYMKLNIEDSGIGAAGAISVETYALDDIVYTSFADTWGKYESGGRLWGDAQFSQKLIEFVGEFDPELADKENVNGKMAFKVVTNPTMEELVSLIATLDPGILSRAGMGGIPEIDNSVKDIEFTVWIDEQEFLPVKADVVLEAETPIINPGGSGVISSNIVISATVNFDYRTPFNIVLPSAAQNAVEL